MNYLSLFNGIGGFDLGLDRAGMTPLAQVEFSPKCRSVLKRHWPTTECFDDVRTFDRTSIAVRPDLICGGFPCQDLSLAGRRAGLAGNRSGLWFEFHRIISVIRPRWVLIENVPGLLSSGAGRDFGILVKALADGGYGVGWRVLDAQFFGVPQRRRRVFIVGHLGDFRRAAEVLFESDSLPWDSPPRRESGARVASSLTSGTATGRGVNRPGRRREDDTNLALCFNAKAGKRYDGESETFVSHTLTGNGFDASEDGTGGGTPLVAQTLGSHHQRNCPDDNVIVIQNQGTVLQSGVQAHSEAQQKSSQHRPFTFQTRIARSGRGQPSEVCSALASPDSGVHGDSTPHVSTRSGVRRLTPRECERLQGFPDDWTRFDADGNELADSPRYQMIGNAVCVKVAEWLGKRIMEQL